MLLAELPGIFVSATGRFYFFCLFLSKDLFTMLIAIEKLQKILLRLNNALIENKNTMIAWRGILMFLVCMFSTCSSHSFLVKPAADWRSKHRAQCRRGGPEADPSKHDKCRGPCISKKSWFYNPDARHTEWTRGSKQIVEWTRNGHNHGFVRLTLVPLKKRRSRKAHSKYTFHFSCFDVNKKKCTEGVNGMYCGTDRWLYSTEVIVPDYVKDGEYVLGWSWYGAYAGAPEGSTQRFHFGDYWSCSYITIKGGNDVVKRTKKNRIPIFDDGGRGRCSAMTNKLGVCKVEPCPDKFREKNPKLWCPRGAKWKKGRCQFKAERKISKSKKKKMKKLKKKLAKKLKSKGKKWLKTRVENSIKKQKRSKCWCANRKKSSAESPCIAAFIIVGLKEDGTPSWKKSGCVCPGVKINTNYFDHGFTLLAYVYGKYPEKVIFSVNGVEVQFEEEYPYAIAGNIGWKFGRYNPPLSTSILLQAKAEPGGETYSVEDVQFIAE